MTDAPQFLATADDRRLAHFIQPGSGPGIVFCPGFKSDMGGTKALMLAEACAAEGRAYTRFDYTGHGASSGAFEDGTIGQWAQDTVDILDTLDGPQVLVGSSMGGWIMLLAALARPRKVAGLVGVAAAPDFTEDLMWARFPAELKDKLRTDGRWDQPSPYDPEPTPITLKLIEEGRTHQLLKAPIRLDVPVRLIHGTADPDVPWQVSATLMEKLTSDDVTLTLIKDGDHRLSDPVNLDRIGQAALDLAAEIAAQLADG